MDVEQFLNENAGMETDCVVPVETHVNGLTGKTGDLEVSQEGFGDIFKQFWQWLIEPGKPGIREMSGGWYKKRAGIIETMNKTYLNPAWLAKRTVREGTTLRLDRSYNYIGINGVIQKSDFDAAIEDYLAKTKKCMDGYGRYLQLVDLDLQVIMRKFNSDPENVNMFHVAALDEMLQSSRVRLDIEYRVIFGNTLVSRVVTPYADTNRPMAADSLRDYSCPALTAEEIVNCCNGILKLSESLDIIGKAYREHLSLKGFIAVHNLINSLDEFISEQEQSQVPEDTEAQQKLMETLETVNGITTRILAFHQQHTDSIIRAYARLIDASVK